MPELPEVEANLRNLKSWGRGRRVTKVVAPPGARERGGLSAPEFVRRIQGRRVEEVLRKGKWILTRLSGGGGLGLHLGMTGKLERGEGPRFSRSVLVLDNGERIHFVDQRRFGKLFAVDRFEELLGIPEVAELGPDALSEINLKTLREALSSTRRSVKDVIMDQHVLSGLGNLYATEALWHAKIHPATPARKVSATPEMLRRLLSGIRASLRRGLSFYGKPKVPVYVEEGGPNPFYAYGRNGEPCRRCKTGLKAIKLGGRTTVFCPKCQARGVGSKEKSR